MAKFKVVLRLAERTVLQLVELARRYLSMTAGNPGVPVPDPPLADTTDKTDELEQANIELQSAKNIVTEKAAIVDTKRKLLEDNMRIAARQVDTLSEGDKAFIESTGLDASSGKTLVYMPQVSDLHLTRGDNPTTIDAQWDPIKRALNYSIQTSPTAPDGTGVAPWVEYPTPTGKSSATLSGFTSGQGLWVRVRANGHRDSGPWSDPAFIIVP